MATVHVEGRGISIADQVEGRGIWNWTGIQHARTDHAMRAHNCLHVRHQAIVAAVGLYIQCLH